MHPYLEALSREFRPTLRSRLRRLKYRFSRECRDSRRLNCGYCGEKRVHAEHCPLRMLQGQKKVTK